MSLQVAGQNPLPIFMNQKLVYKITLGSSHKNKAWGRGGGGRGSSILKIEMLIKELRSRCLRSDTPVGAHLQIVAQQDFQATLRQSVSLRELAATGDVWI